MRRPRVRTTLRSVLRRVGMRSLAVCGGVRGAMRLEVALGHPVDERDEERNHAQAGDQERQEDEQEARDPFPSRQSRRQDRRRNGIADRRRGATGSPGLSVVTCRWYAGASVPGRDRASAGGSSGPEPLSNVQATAIRATISTGYDGPMASARTRSSNASASSSAGAARSWANVSRASARAVVAAGASPIAIRQRPRPSNANARSVTSPKSFHRAAAFS